MLTSSVDNLALRLKEKVNKSTSDVHNPNASNKVIKFPEIEQTEQISEVGVKDDKPGDNEASYRIRLFQHMCLDMEKRGKYNESVGPVKPGYYFYKWLFYGPPLRMPIPDTILIDGKEIRRLRNDASGFVVREKSDYKDDQTARDDFVSSCINSFVVDSHTFGNSPTLANLKGRFVALMKKPITLGSPLVTNSIECFTPLALQTHILEALDTRGNSSDYVLQKFVKGKGAKPSIYRVMWRSVSPGAGVSGNVAGWYITKISDEYNCFNEDIDDDDNNDDGNPHNREFSGKNVQRGWSSTRRKKSRRT